MAEVDDLGSQARRLTDEVSGLRADVVGLGQRQDRSESRLAWIAIALVIVVLMAIAIGVTAYRGYATDRRIDAICPVLALVIGGYDPSTRPEGEARRKYDDSFVVMRQSYTDLACTQPLVPPRKES